MPRWTKSVGDRFLEKIDKGDMTGCWQWTGAISTRWGYGSCWDPATKKVQLAHRLMYRFVKGDIDGDTVVRHSCDNPACVNPDHLSAGSQQDNMDDMVKRGRWDGKTGEDHYRSKLTWDKVRHIRQNRDEKSAEAWAEQYGVVPSTIYCVLSGKTWKE